MSTPVISAFNNRISKADIGAQRIARQDQQKSGGPSFSDSLKALNHGSALQPQNQAAELQSLKFSNHAVERMQTRGVNFSAEELSRIDAVVNKAALKGAKETLVLTDKAAMIVNPKNKTVITVMDPSQLKENVFTNIDSTVMV